MADKKVGLTPKKVRIGRGRANKAPINAGDQKPLKKKKLVREKASAKGTKSDSLDAQIRGMGHDPNSAFGKFLKESGI